MTKGVLFTTQIWRCIKIRTATTPWGPRSSHTANDPVPYFKGAICHIQYQYQRMRFRCLYKQSRRSHYIIWNNSLQFALDVITICVYLQILQNTAALFTKRVGWIYYKMLHPLLHNAQIITKCCKSYYKMRNLLQNALSLQKCRRTPSPCIFPYRKTRVR